MQGTAASDQFSSEREFDGDPIRADANNFYPEQLLKGHVGVRCDQRIQEISMGMLLNRKRGL